MTLVEAYAYNAQHRIDEVASNGFLQHAEYNNSGLLSNTTIQFGNTDRVTQQYTYGSMTELSEYGVSYGAKANIYKYEYDSRGNITQITIDSTTSYDEKIIKYTYDTANQLIQEENELTNRAWIMTYDDAGNMTRREEYLYVNGELGRLLSTQTFTYGKNGWGDVLTGINGTTVASDAIGNITNDGTWTFTWKNGRQLAAMENDSERWDFSYDASGMRTQRSNGNTTYKYTYEGTTLTQMTVGSNTLIFAYGVNGHPMGVKYNGTSYYYVTNAFGDVLAIVDNSGNELVAYRYDAWGNILSTTGSMASTLGTYNPLRYRGYVYDQETGLYYLQSRYYNPAICRFISADSISSLGAGGTAQSYNLFAYCGNNPVSYRRSTVSNGVYKYISSSDSAYSNPSQTGGATIIAIEDVNELLYEFSVSLGANGSQYPEVYAFKALEIFSMAVDINNAFDESLIEDHSMLQLTANVGLTLGKNIVAYNVSNSVTATVSTLTAAKLGAIGSLAGPVGILVGVFAGFIIGYTIDECGEIIIEFIIG